MIKQMIVIIVISILVSLVGCIDIQIETNNQSLENYTIPPNANTSSAYNQTYYRLQNLTKNLSKSLELVAISGMLTNTMDTLIIKTNTR